MKKLSSELKTGDILGKDFKLNNGNKVLKDWIVLSSRTDTQGKSEIDLMEPPHKDLQGPFTDAIQHCRETQERIPTFYQTRTGLWTDKISAEVHKAVVDQGLSKKFGIKAEEKFWGDNYTDLSAGSFYAKVAFVDTGEIGKGDTQRSTNYRTVITTDNLDNPLPE